tara:strand:- start:79 stop:387 length:309 start_codon:yes stop_codon:yes gene_type:complete
MRLSHNRKTISTILIVLLLALKLVNLHQFTHSKDDNGKHCELCLLAQTHKVGDEFTPAVIQSFNPVVFVEQRFPVATVYNVQHKVTLFFGRSLNKAPPVEVV